MRGRKPEPMQLKPKDIQELRHLLRDGRTPQGVAQRARILVACARAERAQQVATKTEQHPSTICRVCNRYRQAGLLAALYDTPRSGRPRVFSQAPTRAA